MVASPARQWIMGDDYTIADIATFPWVRTVRDFYEAGDAVGLNEFKNVTGWLESCMERPASVKGNDNPRTTAIKHVLKQKRRPAGRLFAFR